MKLQMEFLGEVSVYLGLGIEILTAVILGGLVGLDRERKMKPAGIKTNILICLGATLYTSIAILNLGESGGPGDMNRVAAQIVSGIGFLGAGAIIQSRGEIVGLTTAATIWVVAALGTAIGSGYPFIATISTLTVLFVLRLLDPFYRLLDLRRDFLLQILSDSSVKTTVKQLLNTELTNIHSLEETPLDEKNDRKLLSVILTINPKRMRHVCTAIEDVIGVKEVHFHVVSSSNEKKDVEIKAA